ncbi:MAG: fructuronate reductase [Shewanella sp.]
MNISTQVMPTTVIAANYSRAALKTRIVHLGFGAFHRAHQALITDEMLEETGSNWGICEISLFGGEQLIKSLREQNHLYSVMEKGEHSNRVKVIRSVIESLHPQLDGIAPVLDKMTQEQVAIVSMTITEKGYCTDPGTGDLDKKNKLIQQDLLTPQAPVSAIGYIVEALRLRRKKGISPFTVLSCDNVQNNGKVAKAAVIGLAKLLDIELAEWIEANVTFPCTMVDRIVPAATDETLKLIESTLGVADPCAIACEEFRQWVIEDNFVNGRPDWDSAGAEFVSNVVPFEEMKLRMLNGSHSFLAYLGYLGGYPHISDTMTNTDYRTAVYQLMMTEQAPTLNVPEGTDLEAYARLLIARFTNPSLKHQTWQIAMDGSQKLPQRMLESIHFHIEHGNDYKLLALGLAAWMRYVGECDEEDKNIDVRDPLLAQLRTVYAQHGSNVTVVRGLLQLQAIFGNLADNEQFVVQVEMAYQRLISDGARACVAQSI